MRMRVRMRMRRGRGRKRDLAETFDKSKREPASFSAKDPFSPTTRMEVQEDEDVTLMEFELSCGRGLIVELGLQELSGGPVLGGLQHFLQ
jgi:hypothetical protein